MVQGLELVKPETNQLKYASLSSSDFAWRLWYQMYEIFLLILKFFYWRHCNTNTIIVTCEWGWLVVRQEAAQRLQQALSQ